MDPRGNLYVADSYNHRVQKITPEGDVYVLGKRDPFTSLGVIRFLSPLVAAGTLVVARLAWRAGVRHYRSTGT